MGAVVAMLAFVVALLAVLVVGLLRSNAEVLRALHDLGVGEDALAGTAAVGRHRSAGTARSAPSKHAQGLPPARADANRVHDISGVSPGGDAVQVGLVGNPGTTLLAFLSSGCTTCEDHWLSLREGQLALVPGTDTRVVVVTRGPEDESPLAVADLASDRVATVMSSSAWEDYDVPVSPYFILADGTRGVLGEGAATSWAKAMELLRGGLADLGIDLDQPAAGRTRRELLTGMRLEEHASRVVMGEDAEPSGAGPT